MSVAKPWIDALPAPVMPHSLSGLPALVFSQATRLRTGGSQGAATAGVAAVTMARAADARISVNSTARRRGTASSFFPAHGPLSPERRPPRTPFLHRGFAPGRRHAQKGGSRRDGRAREVSVLVVDGADVVGSVHGRLVQGPRGRARVTVGRRDPGAGAPCGRGRRPRRRGDRRPCARCQRGACPGAEPVLAARPALTSSAPVRGCAAGRSCAIRAGSG